MCPPLQPARTCAKFGWRWRCDICNYYSCYLHKAKKCKNFHFGPVLPTLTDDIEDINNDDDDNGWLVDDVTIRRHPSSPAVPAAAE